MPAPQIDTGELGRTGLKHFSGVIFEEELRQLQSDSIRKKIFKEMSETDSTIRAITFVIDMFMRQVDFFIEAHPEDKKGEERVQFLEECRDDMSQSWADTLSEFMSFVTWGWHYAEIVYKYRNGQQKDPSKRSRFSDGKIGWRKFATRAQDTLTNWEFDEEGGVSAMVQNPPPDYMSRIIPIEKALLFRTSVFKGNPEGVSILKGVYIDWYRKKKIENIEAIGIERDLAGFPVIWYPPEWGLPGADASQSTALAAAKEIATNIKRDEQEGVVLPSIYDDNGHQLLRLELLSTGGRRNFDTNVIVERYTKRIAMSVLADFLLLGHEGVGSFALSSDKTNLFAVALGAWLDMITAVFNRHAIPRLFELNGFDLEYLPSLKHADLEKDDLTVMGEFVSKLSAAGVKLDDLETVNYLRRMAGLPEVEEEDIKEEPPVDLNPLVNPLETNPLEQDRQQLVGAVEEMTAAVKKAILYDQEAM